RASLARPGTLVAWRDELELSRRYLSIEQYRLGDRLQMDWRVDGVPDDLPIPQLTLQPLLENALVYGVRASRGRAHWWPGGMSWSCRGVTCRSSNTAWAT
ncbi:sensor histidine kinase, partial [Acinetobacter baumannii]|uniref:sensor histidine kinase n=1 Tax=Acinetobacter baumannii TaxID=470 RepID=UPI003916D6F8